MKKTLSEKRFNGYDERQLKDKLWVEDVREAVLNEIELIRQLIGGILTPEEFWERREKLFGDKLT